MESAHPKYLSYTCDSIAPIFGECADNCKTHNPTWEDIVLSLKHRQCLNSLAARLHMHHNFGRPGLEWFGSVNNYHKLHWFQDRRGHAVLGVVLMFGPISKFSPPRSLYFGITLTMICIKTWLVILVLTSLSGLRCRVLLCEWLSFDRISLETTHHWMVHPMASLIHGSVLVGGSFLGPAYLPLQAIINTFRHSFDCGTKPWSSGAIN